MISTKLIGVQPNIQKLQKMQKEEFPMEGIMSRNCTQVTSFLKKNKKSDGRGIKVGIFDTGVDPGCEGLQKTSDGKPKIIDIIDGTGDGDVNTSKKVKIGKNGILVLKSGKKLFFEKSLKHVTHGIEKWENPSGDYHVGVKLLFEILPATLKTKYEREAEKSFKMKQKQKIGELNEELLKNTKLKQTEKNEINIQIKRLGDLSKCFVSTSPIIDCVLFKNKKGIWKSFLISYYEEDNALFTREEKEGFSLDFSKVKLLSNYKLNQEYATFPRLILNYSVNIYENGNLLSIVTTNGSHGTHVAGIVGSFYPKKPELNGIATGAQIVSIKIGDTRMGTMETNIGMIRALIGAYTNKCDIVNMSFGEFTSHPGSGRFPELLKELVFNHKLFFISSAGNGGPGLSTVNAPGSSASISVGALVPNQLRKMGYGLLEDKKQKMDRFENYSWSSRGPASDGRLGVSLTCPGGQISSVPNWTTSRNKLMNGTSMSSPYCAGSVALLLSCLKQRSIDYTYNEIIESLENSCKKNLFFKPGDGGGKVKKDHSNKEKYFKWFEDNINVLAMGNGVLQIENALKYYMSVFSKKTTTTASAVEPLRYEVTCNGKMGLYVRDVNLNKDVLKHALWVKPIWKNQEFYSGKQEEEMENSKKIQFEKKILLKSTNPEFIKVAKYMYLPNQAKYAYFQANVKSMKENDLKITFILGFDSDNIERGPLFKFPIVLIKPVHLTKGVNLISYENLDFRPLMNPKKTETIKRFFVKAPAGTNRCRITIEPNMKIIKSSVAFSLAVSGFVSNNSSLRGKEFKKFIRISADNKEDLERIFSFRAYEGRVLEICIGKYWSNMNQLNDEKTGEVFLKRLKIEFLGVSILNSLENFSLTELAHSGEVRLKNNFNKEQTISPSVVLKNFVRSLNPVSQKLKILNDERNCLLWRRGENAPGKIYELHLKYELALGLKSNTITLKLPVLSTYLYDSRVGAQRIVLINSDGQILKVQDCWPKAIKGLPKGKYSVMVYIRHDELSLITKIKKTLNLVVSQVLKKSVTLQLYSNVHDCFLKTGERKIGKTMILGSQKKKSIYVSFPDSAAVVKANSNVIKYGESLTGIMSLCSSEYEFHCILPKYKSFTENEIVVKKEEEKEKLKKISSDFKEVIVKNQIEFLKKHAKNSSFLIYLEKILKEFPDNLKLLQLQYQHHKNEYLKEKKNPTSVFELIENLLSLIDTTKLAVHFGTRPSRLNSNKEDLVQENQENKKLVKQMDDQKSILIKVLQDKINLKLESGNVDDLKDDIEELLKWSDASAEKQLYVKYLKNTKENFKLLNYLVKQLTSLDVKSKIIYEEAIVLFESLGWTHWVRFFKQRFYTLFPTEQPIF